MKADAPWIKTPQTAHFMNSGVLEVTVDNLATYEDDLRKLTGDILAKFKGTYMDCKYPWEGGRPRPPFRKIANRPFAARKNGGRRRHFTLK